MKTKLLGKLASSLWRFLKVHFQLLNKKNRKQNNHKIMILFSTYSTIETDSLLSLFL